MRRPVRDERFTDPQGNRWQVLEVGKWRTTTRPPKDGELEKGKPKRPIVCGPYIHAYYVMRNTDLDQMKVTPLEMDTWTPDTDTDGRRIGDPLEGQRKRVAEDIRAGKSTLRLEGAIPVMKGERYHTAGGEIVVGNVTVKTNKRGEKVTEVKTTFIGRDKVYFLRNTVPAAKPGEAAKPPTADDIKKATLDGNYLTGAPDKDGDDLATVPPDWEDGGALKREERRRQALAESNAEAANRRAARKIRAKLDEAPRLGRLGKDLTPELEEIYDRLNEALDAAA